MFIRLHLDEIIIVARVLYDVNLLKLLQLDDLSFSLHFVCATFELDVYMCCELHHAISALVQSMYFCESFSECIELVK